MRALWLEQPERGSQYLMRSVAYVARVLGRRLSRILLYPICAYFFIFSVHARRASKKYLGKIFNRRVFPFMIFRHYFYFASTILDRVFWLSDNYDNFNIQIHADRAIEDSLGRGGCILLGSHLGSFEILRILGIRNRGLIINILMVRENAEKINAVMQNINPELRPRIIEMDGPLSILRVKECLDRGEIVGMLADRILNGSDATPCRFLGEEANFPQGPFQLAQLLNAPIVLGFGLYEGSNNYSIYLEPFAVNDTVPKMVCRYTERLAHYCQKAPYNWFNFYDIWHHAD